MATDDFFRARLDQMIDLRHPLAVLARRMGLTLGELEGHVAAGELSTIPVGRAARMVEEQEAQRFTEARGRCMAPIGKRVSFGARHGV